MKVCDNCGKTEQYPGPVGVRISVEGYHYDINKRPPNLTLDLCKKCYPLFCNKINNTVTAFMGGGKE